MGFDPRWLARLEAAGCTVTAANATAVGPALALANDLALVLASVESAGYGTATLEHRFHPTRKWAFDAAFPRFLVALEREGGKWVRTKCSCGKPFTRFVSRHHDRDGMERDCIKYNSAAIMGWVVVRATPPMFADGRALAFVLEALKGRLKT